LDLINDILDLSKIKLGSEQPNDVEINAPVLVDSMLVLMRERAREASIKITTELQKEMPLLLGDERKLKQILINLMSNSIKFNHPGGSVHLSVRCCPGEGYVFAVEDTGIGIAPHHLAKAMQPFGQIDSDLNRKYAGIGLGLPLAKELADMHGGSLKLESELGAGTTVTLGFAASRNIRKIPEPVSPTVS